MNATLQAMRGYTEHAVSTKNGRRAEYEIIARVTQGLRDTAIKAKSDFPSYAHALHDNQRLWTALVVDVVDKENPLPEDLKARIIYLAEFTRHHTKKVLRKKASVLPLLEINMAVLRGLKVEGPSK
ncbi:flagellar biosynthesis regulator FlaF [uncultured Tateyamaria sp.]|uniref:flagellar biosynthesis regulator FlaF n=2 Tax=uncultured Tateyamaria sp. TaxID=455651 RepID=UPI00262169A3|nr:flagellar biosynthesis regulator FlaF [uncultured Tateyamaria sp.]